MIAKVKGQRSMSAQKCGMAPSYLLGLGLVLGLGIRIATALLCVYAI